MLKRCKNGSWLDIQNRLCRFLGHFVGPHPQLHIAWLEILFVNPFGSYRKIEMISGQDAIIYSKTFSAASVKNYFGLWIFLVQEFQFLHLSNVLWISLRGSCKLLSTGRTSSSVFFKASSSLSTSSVIAAAPSRFAIMAFSIPLSGSYFQNFWILFWAAFLLKQYIQATVNTICTKSLKCTKTIMREPDPSSPWRASSFSCGSCKWLFVYLFHFQTTSGFEKSIFSLFNATL